MMTPDQRYFFDLTGYLHLEGVLQGTNNYLDVALLFSAMLWGLHWI